MISAIVLAAGSSTRMGEQNKLLLDYGGISLIERIVGAALESSAGETIVVLGHEMEAVKAKLAHLSVKWAENPDHMQGMASSVRAGLLQAAPEATGAMICLSDLPLLESGDLNRLIDAFEANPQHSIIVPTYQGQRGNPVLFSMRHRDEVLRNEGAVGG